MKILILISLFVISLSAKAGHNVNNGGIIIICPNLFSSERYSLDYLVAKNTFDKDIKLAPIRQNINVSLARIAGLIHAKLPSLEASFNEFIKNIKNTSDVSAPYFWIKNFSELPEIDDQDILPFTEICGRSVYPVKIMVVQGVVRHDYSTKDVKRIVFDYNYEQTSQLDGLQASFLYVHEWLWDLSKNVTQNRNINYFLHSELFDQLSAEEVQAQMQKYGIKLRP